MDEDTPRSKRKRKREDSEPPTKRAKTGYYYDLPADKFEIQGIRDLIKLGFLYDPQNDCSFFRKLFKLTVPLIKLEKMVGMDKIKEQIVSHIEYFIQGFHERDNEGSMLHCAIYGPPGTGKTRVGTIIGEIYRALGFLSNDQITIGKRTDFIADYLGQTANKTKRFLDKAKGGVLIIDEIYSLSSGNEDHDSYAKEAIDTINQYLSENKKDILCIVIGYEKEVQRCFFDLNKGLNRRFPFRYTIEEYDMEQLKNIFVYQVHAGKWKFSDPDAIKHVVKLFTDKRQYFRDFGGDTETYFLFTKNARSKRLFGKILDSSKFTLEISDLEKGMDAFIINQKKKETSTIPEGMFS